MSFTQQLDGAEQIELFHSCSLMAHTKRRKGFVVWWVNIVVSRLSVRKPSREVGELHVLFSDPDTACASVM